MPLAHRIIPTILCRGRAMVKGTQFNPWRAVGMATQAVRIHQARGVDEVCLLDVGATREGRGPDLSLVEELSDVLFAPLAVGGGIRTLDDVRALLRAGADKVVIGTWAWTPGTENFIHMLADKVGRQAIVVAVDVRGGVDGTPCVRSGTHPIGLLPWDYAKYMEISGAGEILLTSIDREGMMCGYDLDLVRSVTAAVSIPVIAHGGCGSYPHMQQAIEAGASAVAAGAMFQFCDSTPRAASAYLQANGIEARV